MTDTLLKPGIQITKIINQFEGLSLSTPRLATEDCFHWVTAVVHYYEESKKTSMAITELTY